MKHERGTLHACSTVQLWKQENAQLRLATDSLAVEEPLEIRLRMRSAQHAEPRDIRVAITMRTPGDDFALVRGFLYAEGLIQSSEDIAGIGYCYNSAHNVVRVELRSDMEVDPIFISSIQRHFYMHAGCGVCGRTSIEALGKLARPINTETYVPFHVSALNAMAQSFSAHQTHFIQTGGHHAAAFFDAEGRLLNLCEDVGRHNAVDKLVGESLSREDTPYLLMVSSRASFELLHKAVVHQVPVFVAFGAPSTLAVETADQFGITLIGFFSTSRFNVYSHMQRVNTLSTALF